MNDAYACSLMMCTRCGDIDPAVVTYLAENCGMSPLDIDDLMNKQVGVSQPPALQTETQTKSRVTADIGGHQSLALQASCKCRTWPTGLHEVNAAGRTVYR